MSNRDFKDQSQKENILRYVIQAAKANTNITEIEMSYLKDLCEYLDISNEDLHLFLREVNDDIDVPKDEMSRMEILYYLFFILMSDNNIDQSEQDFLFKAALKLGFRPQLINNVLAVFTHYRGRDLPNTALLDEAKKFMN